MSEDRKTVGSQPK